MASLLRDSRAQKRFSIDFLDESFFTETKQLKSVIRAPGLGFIIDLLVRPRST